MVQIELTEHDFDRLASESFRWSTGPYRDYAHAFENFTDRQAEKDRREPKWDWTWAHEVGDGWANVVLARAFLQSINEPFEIVWSMNDPHPSYLVLCNFAPSGWDPKEGE